MVLRFLMRYLANNENLINKLADSKPIRRAAQLVVYYMHRADHYGIPSNRKELGERYASLLSRFSSNLKKEIAAAKEDLKKKQSK
ncbi:protein NCBP2AS2 homolog [Diprion similis]|uniref:protein NCBP2AS2 homolog n=1 Tax=Diprion similis TaxID=362088 RepID=UPI001EF766ED|nr:protein NCBP2AS2 homolog [Diprion similis]